MTASVLVAAVLAVLSALAFATATVAQYRAAARSSDRDARGIGFVWQLLRRPQWWAGTLGNTLGYALQAVALGVGSLLVVQPILVTYLLFALPLGARLARRRLPKAVWVWGTVLVVSLALFVTLGDPNRGISHASGRGWLIVAAVVTSVVAACVLAAHPRSGAVRASLLAVAVGLLAGLLAVLTKGVAATAPQGVAALLGTGETYGLVVVGLAGVYLQQLAFQAGALQASLPVIAVLEPVAAAGLGMALLHEQLQAAGVRLAVLIAAAVAMTMATIALARDQAEVVPVGAAPGVEMAHG